MKRVGEMTATTKKRLNEKRKSLKETSMIKKDLGNNKKVSARLRYEKAARVERIAKELVRRFDSPESYRFFLKCAWHLSEAQIWELWELAHRPGIHNPIKYFVASASVAMSLNSVK